jgi:two-component system, sensor histidine kinase PdtaS
LHLCTLENRTLLSNAESIEYAEELVKLAKTSRDTTAWIEGCLCAASKLDQLKSATLIVTWLALSEQLAKNRPQEMAKVMYWKGNFLLESGQAEKALQMFREGLRLFKNQRNSNIYHIRLLGVTAKYHSTKNEIHLADSLGKSAIQHSRTAIDSAEAFRYWGGIQENLGRPDEAISAYLRAYRIEKKNGSIIVAAYNLRQAASILRDQGQYLQAITYFEESIELAKRMNYNLGLASAWHSLGSLYQQTGQYDEALHYFRLSLSLKKELGRPKKILTTIRNMSELYFETKQYDSCVVLNRQYLPLCREIKQPECECQLLFLATLSAAKLGKMAEAKRYLLQGESAILNISVPDEKPKILRLAAQSNALLGFHKKAYDYQQKSQSAQDSIYNIEKSRIISEMEMRFNTNRKESQIADLVKDNELKNIHIAADRARQMGLQVGLALLVILAFVLYRNVINRKRHNIYLQQTNAELTQKNQDVKTLLHEIHHRVKNNLQIISSLLHMQSRKVSDESTLEALRTGQARVRSMGLLHQLLYQGEELKNISMHQYINELSKSLFDTYHVDEDRIRLITQIDDIEMDIDSAVPLGLIINELITNSLKYAFPNDRRGEIKISLKKNNQEFYFEIVDNGIGIPLKNGKPIGTNNSFGFELVESLSQKLDGQLKFYNGVGSRITLNATFIHHAETYNS